MASFTFGSLGDIISISLLVKDLVIALSDSRGSSDEYQELIRELWTLDRVLLEVEQLSRTCDMTAEMNGLCVTARRIVDICRVRMGDFLEKVKKYNSSLASDSSDHKIRTMATKVRWRVAHSGELQTFRAEINAHCASLNVLLVAASMKAMRANEKKAQERYATAEERHEAAKDEQNNVLLTIRDYLTQNASIVRNAAGYLCKIFMMNLAIFQTVSEIRTSLPSRLERSLFEEPFLLEDPIGRITPVHLQFITSWEAFDSVLEARFRNLQGHNKILKKDFVLQERRTRKDISRTMPWEGSILPGHQVDMSIVFVHTHNPQQIYCPGCLRVCGNFSRVGTQCTQCGMWFGVVVEMIDFRPMESSSHQSLTGSTKTVKNSRPSGAPSTSKSPENVLIPSGEENMDPPSTPTNISTTGQLEKSISSIKRPYEGDCLLMHDLSPFKRLRIISKQERVNKSIGRHNGPSKNSPIQWRRPRWSMSLYQVLERMALDSLQKTESRFGLYHGETLRAIVVLADILRVRRQFDASQNLLERAISVQNNSDIPGLLDMQDVLDLLVLVFMDQNRLQEAEETCHLMVSRAEEDLGLNHLRTEIAQRKLHYVLRLSGQMIEWSPTRQASQIESAQHLTTEVYNKSANLSEAIINDCCCSNNSHDIFCEREEVSMSGYFETVTISSSVFDFELENGRTYHAYHPGTYCLPNDEEERDRLDLQYHIITNVVLEGKYFLAPIQTPRNILDHGTGTGTWAIDVADAYPESTITGTDLSPIQPKWIPPNLTFEVDDFEDFDQAWYRQPESYDLIHCCLGNAFSYRNWGHFLSESYRCLAPGGWVEIKDVDIAAVPFDDSLSDTSAIARWHNKLQEGATIGNINLRLSSAELKHHFEEAGFTNVTVFNRELPVGAWTGRSKERQLGQWLTHLLKESLASFSLAIFTRYLDWSTEQLEELLEEVRRELKEKSLRWYWPFFVVYGQRPEV